MLFIQYDWAWGILQNCQVIWCAQLEQIYSKIRKRSNCIKKSFYKGMVQKGKLQSHQISDDIPTNYLVACGSNNNTDEKGYKTQDVVRCNDCRLVHVVLKR